MRICFLSESTAEKMQKVEKAEAYFFSFNEEQIVKYEEELRGKTDYFETFARFTKEKSALAVCGTFTDTCGHLRKSAIIAERGKILGVSDTLYVTDKKIGSGGMLRVYETEKGRMGVVVAEDLFFPGVFENLTACGSDFIVCVFSKVEEVHLCLIRALAVFYGTPIFFCGKNKSATALPTGALALQNGCAEIEIKKSYQLIEKRRKGNFP